MGIDFYYTPGSAPCRNVLLTAKVLGVDLNLKHLNLMEGEHLKPEFIKINPQHCVPTLDDNGFALWESRAICGYLVNQYGKDDSLYPKDPKKRAIVDARLYFDMGTLYASFAEYYYPQLFAGAPKDPAKLEKINNAFKYLDLFLEKTEYAAGDKLTIADLVLVSSVSTFDVMEYDVSQYKNVSRWFAKIKALPAYEEGNGKPVIEFKNLVDRLTKK